MAIETTANRISYAGNGSTTAFAFPYKFLANADLVVIIRSSLGVETTKTLTTHYTLVGAGVAAGGTVTMITAPATGETLIVYNDPAATQGVDLRENDSLPAETVEEVFDRLTILAQRLKDRVDRTIRLTDGFSPSFVTTLPSDINLAIDKIPLINATGTGFAAVADWPSITGVTAGMAASAAAAATSATNAATSATASAGSATAAATSATNAATSATSSATSATASAGSATSAAASAASAASTLASALWREVVRKTFADSPYTVTSADNGKLIVVDTTGGAVVVNLPSVATITLPFTVGVQLDAGTNGITVNRNGTDTIDGLASKTISVSGSGAQFLADATPSPDEWEVMEFGAQSGNLTADVFSGTGAQTAFVLSVDPGSKNNTFVYVEGIYQAKSTYSLSGTTLTFSEAPPLGTSNVEVISGTTLSLGVPSDGTVTPAKMASQSSAAKTGAYTLTDSDDYIEADTSAGAFTLTLHNPVTAKKKPYYLEYTNGNGSNFNALTVSGTVEGVSGNSLNTKGEVLALFPNGTEWKIINRRLSGVMNTNLALTFDNFAATVSYSQWWRVGKNIWFRGYFNSGGGIAGTAAISIPTVAIDTTDMSATANVQPVGILWRMNSASNTYAATSVGPWPIFYDGSTSSKVFITNNSTTSVFSKVNASSLASAADNFGFQFCIPISGWKG